METRPTYQLKGVSGVVLKVDADDFADHGVLSHEHGGGAAERETDLGHLVRPDIVSLGEGAGACRGRQSNRKSWDRSGELRRREGQKTSDEPSRVRKTGQRQ